MREVQHGSKARGVGLALQGRGYHVVSAGNSTVEVKNWLSYDALEHKVYCQADLAGLISSVQFKFWAAETSSDPPGSKTRTALP